MISCVVFLHVFSEDVVVVPRRDDKTLDDIERVRPPPLRPELEA